MLSTNNGPSATVTHNRAQTVLKYDVKRSDVLAAPEANGTMDGTVFLKTSMEERT